MKKILVVDDSSTMLLLEQLVLDSSGYQILTARDGSSGLRTAMAHRPDLMLLEGFEVCRQLRACEATREIPILLVANRSEEAQLRKGFLPGCNDSISKPINNNELLSKVKDLLGMNSEGESRE